jgi:hypothetical protein
MKTSPPKKQPLFEIVLNVIGYQEDGEWVALALEMDLRGYGKTFEAATADLRDLVCMQIHFAHFKNQPAMIMKAADPIWFTRYAELRAERMGTFDEVSVDQDFQIAGLPLPPPNVIANIRPRYTLADGEA